MVIQYAYKTYATLNNFTAMEEHFIDKNRESNKGFLSIRRSGRKPPVANESW